jgi:hypothetical protein
MTGPIETHAVLPGLLDSWGIPPEGRVYVSKSQILESDARGRMRTVFKGFQWSHLESTTKISLQKGFATRREAVAAAQDRAKLYGAFYGTGRERAAKKGVSK